jgi:putative DNA primase/helicase
MKAETIAKALGGRKAGGIWMAPCPAHDDHTPSLSIRDAEKNKVLVRCHAGCDQERVIAALRGRGLWVENGPCPLSRVPRPTPVERNPEQDVARRSEIAVAIWNSAKPARGTPVETYLASRDIDLPPPDALRFHAGLKHPQAASGRRWWRW